MACIKETYKSEKTITCSPNDSATCHVATLTGCLFQNPISPLTAHCNRHALAPGSSKHEFVFYSPGGRSLPLTARGEPSIRRGAHHSSDGAHADGQERPPGGQIFFPQLLYWCAVHRKNQQHPMPSSFFPRVPTTTPKENNKLKMLQHSRTPKLSNLTQVAGPTHRQLGPNCVRLYPAPEPSMTNGQTKKSPYICLVVVISRNS